MGVPVSTYQDIQNLIRTGHGRTVKTCWIAHVKELNGFVLRRAPNRISTARRQHPCPQWARGLIEDAMRLLGDLD